MQDFFKKNTSTSLIFSINVAWKLKHFFFRIIKLARRFQELKVEPDSQFNFEIFRPATHLARGPTKSRRTGTPIRDRTSEFSPTKFYEHSNYYKKIFSPHGGSPTTVSTASPASPATTRYAESAQRGK